MAVPPPRADDVLEFLTARGFTAAAAALRDELLGLPVLPPVRTAAEAADAPPQSDDESSGSDKFLSMGSSPSELNPYGLWSMSGAKSNDSSDRYSEFGTARDFNGFNLFSDTVWYLGDSYPEVPNSSSEDKFVMSMEEGEDRLRKGDDGSSELDDEAGHNESYGCSSPLCGCCNAEVASRGVKSNSSVYGRYRIMLDETETLDDYGEEEYQLKRIDEVHDSHQERESKAVDSQIAEQTLRMLDELPSEESTFTHVHPTSESNTMESANYHVKANSMNNVGYTELAKEDYEIQLAAQKIPQLDANVHGGSGAVDKEPQDATIRLEGEDKDANIKLEGEDNGATDELQLQNYCEDEYEVFDLRIIHRKNRTGFEENKDLPIILNTVIAGRYYVTEHLGSAAFSKVVQAHDLQTGVDVCLKIIKNNKDFFDQSLDEIKLLKFVNKYDPADECHVMRLYDYFYLQEHLFIVCELLRENLYEFQKFNQESGSEVYFTLPRIQAIARQCLEALEYLHHLRIIHCDLKPENMLIKSYSRCEIKIIDLGSSCFETDELCLYVQSRSYRAPEVILRLPYDQKIDIWSLGCVLAELYTGDVLFPNDSLAMVLARIIGILGPIDMEMLKRGQETHKYFTNDYDLYHRNEETDQVEYLIPEKSSLASHLQVSDAAFVDFLDYLLQINPNRRPTASRALQHHWLSSAY